MGNRFACARTTSGSPGNRRGGSAAGAAVRRHFLVTSRGLHGRATLSAGNQSHMCVCNPRARWRILAVTNYLGKRDDNELPSTAVRTC